MRFARRGVAGHGHGTDTASGCRWSATCKCGVGLCGHCQLGPLLLCRDGPVVDYAQAAPLCWQCGSCDARRPTLAVWKFASCDGCQLTLLDCEDELLTLAGEVTIAHFLEASSEVLPGPYDVSLVEGRSPQPPTSNASARCASSPGPWSRSAPARPPAASRRCATSPTSRSSASVVYASPQYIDTLATSTPISAHVPVDFELRGCPIDRRQLLEVISAFLVGRKPDIPDTSVCTECKRRGLTCVMVADGTPCLGPVTHAGLRRAVPGGRPRLLRLLRPDDRRRTSPP